MCCSKNILCILIINDILRVFQSRTTLDVLSEILYFLRITLVTEVKIFFFPLMAHTSKLQCSPLVFLSYGSTRPRYRGPGDIDLIFCLFGLTPSAGLVTDDKCIIKQQLSQLKLHIHNEMQVGVKVGGFA